MGDRWNVVEEWRCEETIVEGWWRGERWLSLCKYWGFATFPTTGTQLQIQKCNFFKVGPQTSKRRWEISLRNRSTWDYTLHRHRTSNKLWSNSQWSPALWRTITDTRYVLTHTQGDERTLEIQIVVPCLVENHHSSYTHTGWRTDGETYLTPRSKTEFATPSSSIRPYLYLPPNVMMTTAEKKNYQKGCFYTNNY